MTFFHSNPLNYRAGRLDKSHSNNQKSDASTGWPASSRSPGSCVVPGKEQRSPNTQHSALRRIMNPLDYKHPIVNEIFFLNIKRNILYKSKHKGSFMKRENKPQIGGGWILHTALPMWWQKHEIQVQETTPSHPVDVTLSQLTFESLVILIPKWESFLLPLTHEPVHDQIRVYVQAS